MENKFEEFVRMSGKNLAKQIVAARKLGMNLSIMAGIADKLLEFETSIEKSDAASGSVG